MATKFLLLVLIGAFACTATSRKIETDKLGGADRMEPMNWKWHHHPPHFGGGGGGGFGNVPGSSMGGGAAAGGSSGGGSKVGSGNGGSGGGAGGRVGFGSAGLLP